MSTPQTYKGNGNHSWEYVHHDDVSHTQRLRVPGGWLYMSNVVPTQDAEKTNTTTTFVPMPEVVGKPI